MNDLLQRFPRPVIVVDDALIVLNANERAAVLFGLRQDDGIAETLTAWLTEQDLGDELALATARLVNPGDEETFEWRRQDHHYDVSVTKAKDDECFYVFFIDVTEARLTERIHLDARHYLEAILADIPLGIAVLDEAGRITFANRQMLKLGRRLVGRGDLVELIGSQVADLAPDDTGERWRTLCVAAMAADEATEGEREHLLNGDLVTATQAQPLHDHRGKLTGAILIVEDVTEQARLESELIKMERLATVGQMVITVNHEINNPLVIISTNAQSLRLLNKDLDEKSKTKLERIEKQVKRISEVTERLRTLDEVSSAEYITDGPAMVDIWGTSGQGSKGSVKDSP